MNDETRHTSHRRPVIDIDDRGQITSIDVGSSCMRPETDVCDFKIRCGYVAGAFAAKPLENKLKAYCDVHGLDLKFYKSGLFFKDIDFVIGGSGTQAYAAKMDRGVQRLLRRFC